MSETIDLTSSENITSTASLGKRKVLHSELFTGGSFTEKDLPPEHKLGKTQREVNLNCPDKTLFCKVDDSNTTNLLRHLDSDKNPKKAKKSLTLTENQNTLDEFVGHTATPFEFSQENFCKHLIKWIIVCDILFTTCENKYFREMVEALNSDAIVPSANEIENDVLKSFEEEQKKLKKLFQDAPGKISFALDAWTSMNGQAFLAITTHWITKDWRLQNNLLDFVDLSGPHSGENLCSAFVNSCQEFGILEKIFAITNNNISNDDTFMRNLEDVCKMKNIPFDAVNSHCHCIVHVMNLVVQDILKQIKAGEAQIEDDIFDDMNTTTTTEEVIPKLRKLIVKIRSSPKRRKQFARQAKVVGLKNLKLILDVKTGWISTYEMLERAFEMREALDATASLEKELQTFELTDDEWKGIEEIISVLKIFVKTAKLVSSAKYSTLTFTVPIYNYLMDELAEYYNKSNSPSELVTAVEESLKKLEAYYEKTDDIKMYSVAIVLDPRLKLGYYEDNKWKQNLVRYAKDTVFDIYNTNYAPTNEIYEEVDNNDEDDLLNHIFGKQKNQKNEVELYLKAPRAARNQDVLLWWKVHEVEYPHLAAMARDYLAITATSDLVERIFSGEADLILAKRYGLKTSTIRACMCLKSWWSDSSRD